MNTVFFLLDQCLLSIVSNAKLRKSGKIVLASDKMLGHIHWFFVEESGLWIGGSKNFLF